MQENKSPVCNNQREQSPCQCTAWEKSRHWRLPESTSEQVSSTCQHNTTPT